MHIQSLCWSAARGWGGIDTAREPAHLVLYFGSREGLTSGERYRELRALFPTARIAGCSTGGQIQGDDIYDEEVVAAALRFDRTQVRLFKERVASREVSRACGAHLARQLTAADLAGVFVLSDGLIVDGSELVAGFTDVLGASVPITGGFADDGPRFEETLVGADEEPSAGQVVAVGFYGEFIRIGYGCAGGWDLFGPRRKITKARGPVLIELDGEPALDLYDRYLGEEEAANMPSSGVVFPLRIHDPAEPDCEIVRSVFGVDRDARTLTLAADIPDGCTAQLMRGNFDRLAAGAGDAGRQAHRGFGSRISGAKLAILVSCTGRRLAMGQRTLDEIEAVGAELGEDVARIGFYSYGEIAPSAASRRCELHNQSMMVTTIAEAAI